MSLSIEFDTSAFASALDKYAQGIKSSIRPAAQSAAQVLYDDIKPRVPVSTEMHYFYGSSYRKYGTFYGQDGGSNLGPTRPYYPGNLRKSIYQVYSKDNSEEGVRATYHISWNRQKAPYGHMVELGTSRAAAQPFLRPAFDAKVGEMKDVIRVRMQEGMRKIIAGMKS